MSFNVDNISWLEGSICKPNFKFWMAYSCPQNTAWNKYNLQLIYIYIYFKLILIIYFTVVLGNVDIMLINASCIWVALPSKNRPHPPKNNVSPVMKNITNEI